MAARRETKLDEIQWHSPQAVFELGGVHSNTVLFYFAQSPFFDLTSNNAVLFNQGIFNPNMRHLLATRDAFEARLRSMSGLEFIVAQEPAETGPGMGTGVWVIRKQTRRKPGGGGGGGGLGEEDDITVHASYFVVGENIYMAPTLGDMLNARIASMSTAMAKLFPAANSIQNWSPARGHVYKTLATTQTTARPRSLESKEATPMPDGLSRGGASDMALQKTVGHGNNRSQPDARLAEESFAIHLRFGGDYMDENPITGKPGEFHLSSTGRKDVAAAAAATNYNKLAVPPPPQPQQQQQQQNSKQPNPNGNLASLPSLNTKVGSPVASSKDSPAKPDKSPRVANGVPKPKRRKSKGGTLTPS